jgi:RHS repeat-associated protein
MNSLALDVTRNRISGLDYDPSGNMTYDGQYNYAYDAENRMVTGAGAAYYYDGAGLRVKKEAGATTRYIFSGTKVIAEYVNGAAVGSPTREYVYSGSALLATIEGTTTTYHHQDHLSVRVNTDAQGTKIGEQGNYPFGEFWYSSSSTTKWRFTSYERDAESGNDYAFHRYHSNRLGRFLSPDPLLRAAGDPQSLNRYAYTGNDPVNRTDPSGLISLLNGDPFWMLFSAGTSGAFIRGRTCMVDGLETSCQYAAMLLGMDVARPGPADLAIWWDELNGGEGGIVYWTTGTDGSAGYLPKEWFGMSTAGHSVASWASFLDELDRIASAYTRISPDALPADLRKKYMQFRNSLNLKDDDIWIYAYDDDRFYATVSKETYDAIAGSSNYTAGFNPGTHGPYWDSYRQNVPTDSIQVSMLPPERTLLQLGFVGIQVDRDQVNPNYDPWGHLWVDVFGLGR